MPDHGISGGKEAASTWEQPETGLRQRFVRGVWGPVNGASPTPLIIRATLGP